MGIGARKLLAADAEVAVAGKEDRVWSNAADAELGVKVAAEAKLCEERITVAS
jgi:hypothetical protein